MLDWVLTEHDNARVLMVGHSVGGQVAGMLDNVAGIDGMVTLSAQSGHWRLQGAEQKYLVALHMHLTFPLLASVFGYLPWSKMGSSEDLPKGVALEWARWCRHRDYLLGDSTLPLDRYRAFEAPVLAYSFGDDKWGTPASVEPAGAGLQAIGHLGFFRPSAARLWGDAIEWMDSRCC
ncbi:MAG: hypothetical protein JKY37_21940 [Nannocystaceae bacterium]|nr:hypothetical protein [Nannocystaceae bacterium]